MNTPIIRDATAGLVAGTWQLDPARSSAEFHVRNLWGMMTVKGRFDRFQGTLDLSERPAVALVVDADSVNTGNARRDTHLRSGDFLDAATHPQVHYEDDAADLDGDNLTFRGLLYAAGKHVPLDVAATVSPDGDEFAIEATAQVDQRELGMTFSPLGMVRAPSRLLIRGWLVRADDAR